MKKYLISLKLLCVAIPAFADNFQIPEDKKIIGFHVYSDKAQVIYSPAHSNNAGCNGNKATYSVVIDWSSDENMKAMYSAALAAFASGKTVGFGVGDCLPVYGGDTPKAYRLDVKQ